MGETVIRTNAKRRYIYAAYDVGNDELLIMKAYTARDVTTTLDFIRGVLKQIDKGIKDRGALRHLNFVSEVVHVSL